MWGEFETVYAVTDYYDGILAGIAEFRGWPHVFVLERQDEALYRLTPVAGGSLPALRSSPPIDIWTPPTAIEGMVRAAVSSHDGGLLVRADFSPTGPSSPAKP